MHFGVRFFEQRAVVARHAANHVRIDADPVIRKHGECRNVLEQLHVRGAERQRQIRRQRRGNTKAPGHIHHAVNTHFFRQLYRRHVAGPGKRSPQRNGALKFLVVVVRRIRLSAANGCEGRIHNRVKRRGALFDGVRIDINLERTPHLPQRLRRAIELGVLEAVAADHRLDLAGCVVDGHHRALRPALLFQLNARRAVPQFLDRELRQVAHFQEFSWLLPSGPGKILRRENGAIWANLDQSALVVHLHDQPRNITALLDGMAPVIVLVGIELAQIVAQYIRQVPAPAVAPLVCVQSVANCLIRRALHGDVQRGVDPEPAFMHSFASVR